MSKGAVAKSYQPYRKLAEELALRVQELESLVQRAGLVERDGQLVRLIERNLVEAEAEKWKARALKFRSMYIGATADIRDELRARFENDSW